MAELFSHINQWHWWGLAVALIILEVFAPGTFFLWPAVAAVVMGVLLLLWPAMGWEFQVLAFALLSVASVLAWRRYRRDQPEPSDRPTLNRRAQQYVGRTFTLDEPIVNGQGRMRVDDSVWRIAGSDLPAATRVRVTGVDGTILRVDRVES